MVMAEVLTMVMAMDMEAIIFKNQFHKKKEVGLKKGIDFLIEPCIVIQKWSKRPEMPEADLCLL